MTRFAATERYGGLGNDSGGASIAASADSMNDFQISAGNVPPTTGRPWNSERIGTSLFG